MHSTCRLFKAAEISALHSRAASGKESSISLFFFSLTKTAKLCPSPVATSFCNRRGGCVDYAAGEKHEAAELDTRLDEVRMSTLFPKIALCSRTDFAVHTKHWKHGTRRWHEFAPLPYSLVLMSVRPHRAPGVRDCCSVQFNWSSLLMTGVFIDQPVSNQTM
ncbi:hypothetical protein FVE85_9656 [Porphyridium purpureum]|uniref:Uncharacterized protein n=1 Tax=Porphyridium purpureum TaxID=35688 RepID=A0A5J4YJN4_PORPP|nr:hypothetical protein FVE85_9656 [Porphyridium purpureum]|eukprot:POR5493..scf246_12